MCQLQRFLKFPTNVWDRALPNLCDSAALRALTDRGTATFHWLSWAWSPGLNSVAQRSHDPVLSHAGSLKGRGFVPCACHSVLYRGQWSFCEFSSERTGPLSGSGLSRMLQHGEDSGGAGKGRVLSLPELKTLFIPEAPIKLQLDTEEERRESRRSGRRGLRREKRSRGQSKDTHSEREKSDVKTSGPVDSF